MLHRIWLVFIVSAFAATMYQAVFGDHPQGFQDVMSMVSSMATLSVEIAIGLIGVLAFWRETTAQHFNTRTGQYKPTGCAGHNCSASCKQVHDPSWATDLNAQVTGVMRAGGIEVLPAFHESLQMWTDHVGRRRVARDAGAHSHDAPLDCTHFCEPARLFTRMTQQIVSLSNGKVF